jgi:hypothetical protein
LGKNVREREKEIEEIVQKGMEKGTVHKVRTYKEYHSVRPSSELGLSQPLSRQRVFPSRGHTSLRLGGWGESQFRRGAYTVVLFICTYFVGQCD